MCQFGFFQIVVLLGHTLYELFHSLKMNVGTTEDFFVFTSYIPLILFFFPHYFKDGI